VIIWDDKESRCVGELAFRSEVRGVRLRRDRIVVVLEHKIFVFSFPDLTPLHQVETLSNPKGLCAVSQSPENFVMACPARHPQRIRVELFHQRRGYVGQPCFSQPAWLFLWTASDWPRQAARARSFGSTTRRMGRDCT
ncbi:unnamed protein product, partial [Closterium sp. Naga37s-1]